MESIKIAITDSCEIADVMSGVIAPLPGLASLFEGDPCFILTDDLEAFVAALSDKKGVSIDKASITGELMRVRFNHCVVLNVRNFTDRPDEAFLGEHFIDTIKRLNELDFFNRYTITISQAAFLQFKHSVPAFDIHYPKLTIDASMTLSLGMPQPLLYCVPGVYGKGCSLDYNAAYTSIMINESLPYGKSKEVFEEPKKGLYMLDVQYCIDGLRPGAFPIYRTKNQEPVEKRKLDRMVMTSVEWDLLQETYFLSKIEKHHFYKFHSRIGAFNDFLVPWTKAKEAAPKGSVEYRVASLVLHACYGKFRQLEYTQRGFRSWTYPPMAAFIVAYQLRNIARLSAKIGRDKIIYINADSIMIKGEIPAFLNGSLRAKKTGKLKVEYNFKEAKILGVNQYMLNLKTRGYHLCVAGCPLEWQKWIKWKDFAKGYKVVGKWELGRKINDDLERIMNQ